MKRFLTIFFVLMTLSFQSLLQAYTVYIDGVVTDVNGNAVEGVTLLVDLRVSPGGPSFYSNTLHTTAAGFYSDSIDISANYPQGMLFVNMVDCDSTTQQANFIFGFGNNNEFEKDFTWCANLLPCSVELLLSTVPGSTAVTITAIPNGAAPFTFFWNNSSGTDNPTLTVTQSGTYCVAVFDNEGCSVTTCATVVIAPPFDSCSVAIFMDSTISLPALTAYPTGEAPFTYLWSTGETTQSILVYPNPVGILYCVTVTDANGCVASACWPNIPPNNCTASIQYTPNGLTALPNGVAPYEYYWNNGATTKTIQPVCPGTYCVTVTDATNCKATACYTVAADCSVEIFSQPLSNTAGSWILTAVTSGTGPFSFQWDNVNSQMPTVIINEPGTYCVKVFSADSCEATACIDFGNVICDVEISMGLSSNSFDTILIANTPSSGYSYYWSTGDSTPYILLPGPGTYCVTVVHSSGCSATDCFQFGPFIGNFTLQGFVSVDQLNANLVLQGTAYLYTFTNTTPGLSLMAQTPLMPNPTLPPYPGANAWYSFGEVPAGKYVVIAVLAPNTPLSDLYLPTYYGDALTWPDAEVIEVPHSGGLFNIHLVKGDSLSGGPGTIDGLVSKGPGFVSSSGAERGDAVEGATVLLFDADQQPLNYRLSAADGAYSFEGLPWGTYLLLVDILGVPATPIWITLGPDQPSTSVNFQLTAGGVTTAGEVAKLITAHKLWPNPAKDLLQLELTLAGAFDAAVQILTPQGQAVLSKDFHFAAGEQQISLRVETLPAGMYFLVVRNGKDVGAWPFTKGKCSARPSSFAVVRAGLSPARTIQRFSGTGVPPFDHQARFLNRPLVIHTNRLTTPVHD